MPSINLLPWREQQRKERRVAFFVSLAAAGLAAVVTTGAGYLAFKGLISAQESRNGRLRDEIRTLDAQIQEINNLESQKQRFIGRMQVIDKLQRSRSEIVHMFDEVVSLVPDGVYLTSFKQSNRRLRFDGVTQSSNRLSTMLRNIDGSQWVKNGSILSVESKTGQKNGSSFTLFADQVSTAEEDEAAKASSKRVTTRRTTGATQ